MPVEHAFGTWLVAAILACAPAAAFEPGTPRVCKPSADGQRFECHDRTAVDASATPAPAAAALPAPSTATAPPAAETVTVDTDAPRSSTSASSSTAPSTTSGARALPNYLLQTPRRGSSPAAPAATGSSRVVAATAFAPSPGAAPPPPSRPPSLPDAGLDAAEDNAGPVAATTAATTTGSVRAQRAAPPEDAATPAAASVPPQPLPAQPISNPPARIVAAGAAEFRRLPSERYTVELAKADQAGAFTALIAALGEVDGTLYVVGLRGPVQRSWHLLWSDFASIDDARDARSGLPTDVAITPAWPRRIGALQAELDAP